MSGHVVNGMASYVPETGLADGGGTQVDTAKGIADAHQQLLAILARQ